MSLSLVYLLLSINLVLFVNASSIPDYEREKLTLQQWNSYKIQFNKTYESAKEDERRMKIYLDNAAMIAQHNERFEKGEVSYELGMNHFGDMTMKEFAETYTPSRIVPIQNNNSGIITPLPSSDVPEKKDWRAEGAVSEVKNQNQCGSCWAFAVAGVVEGHVFIHNQKRIPVTSLSAQDILDCTAITVGRNNLDDCKGGYLTDAFDYIKLRGVVNDKLYPYTNQKGPCQNKSLFKRTKIASYEPIIFGDVNDVALMKQVVGTIGPVVCSLSTKGQFQFYKSGIYESEDCCKNEPDHALVIVGYDTDVNGKDYWLVKNSWGINWGENGYIRVRRNNNVCGIENNILYPIM